MIYIFCALYPEAAPWISAYHLKKVQSLTHFQTFTDDKKVVLVITGVGRVAAAAAVGSICTKYGIDEKDILVNIGVCAAMDKKEQEKTPGADFPEASPGELYLCHKITEEATGKTYYPDILVKHFFREGTLVTGDRIYDKADGERRIFAELYDMEAAAVYQAGSCFFGPEQMVFLKVVSDFGEAARISREKIILQMEQHQEKVLEFLEHFKGAIGEDGDEQNAEYENCFLTKWVRDFRCSETMKHTLKQLYRYSKAVKLPFEENIEKLYEQGLLPCADRKEGKKRLEEIREWILE